MGRYENKEIVRRYMEHVVNTGNLDAMHEFLAQDYIGHNAPSGSSQGIEQAKRHLEAVHHVFGDFHVAIEDQIAEDDTVATRVSGTGIHQNEWSGLQPSGRRITLTGIHIDKVVDGKIVEHWAEADLVSALMQMGARIVQSEAQT